MTLAVEGEGQVNSVEVFNPSANYSRNKRPISSVINTRYIVAKFINTELFFFNCSIVLFVTGDVNKRDA